jgi:glycerol-3-phosphate dehydrogenase
VRRDLDALAAREFDLLVVGGGIHGLFAAYDAAARGLSTALVEAADFGSGLSFNHQRTLHGGLRALQGARFGKTRRQITERTTWARIAPHLIAPLPFLIGAYGWTTRSRWALRSGLRVYDWLGRHRNRGVTPELHVPAGRVQSRAATLRLFPGIRPQGLTGGATWYDYQTRHPDRLTWLVALAAERAGATLVNYARATAPMRTDRRVAGAVVEDALSGRTLEVRARAILVAAGSGLDAVLRAYGARGAPPLLRAMNLLVDRPSREIALAARGSSGRMLTAVPWAGATLVGTAQSATFVEPSESRPSASAIDDFLDDANTAFPALHATRQDIRLVHHGLTPATKHNGRVDLLPEHQIIDHRHDGVAGLVSLVGVKYTTARWAAQRAVDVVCRRVRRPISACKTSATVLPHGGITDVHGRLFETQRDLKVSLDDRVAEHIANWYGSEAPEMLRYAAGARLLQPLGEGSSVLAGEIAYAVERASAVRLADAVLRRTSLAAAAKPTRAALERSADIMGQMFGWTAEQRAAEIRDVETRFEVPTAP